MVMQFFFKKIKHYSLRKMAYTNTVTDFMAVTEKSLQCDI